MAKLYKLRNIHSSKDDDDRRTQGNAADDLGHAAATDRQSCKKFPKRLKACVEAEGGHLECLYANNNFTSLSSLPENQDVSHCLLYTSPSPRDGLLSRMPSSA